MTREVSVSIPGRIVYVTGSVNGAAHVFTANAGKWAATVARAENDVYEVTLTAIDDAGTQGHYSTTVYYGAQLITDRTETDVRDGTAKGYYNAADLNRVGYATKFLAERLADAGYWVEVKPKLDWLMQDIPDAGQMTQYLGNVKAIRDGFYGDVALPQSMAKLKWDSANRIEQALSQVGGYIDNMQAAYVYAGEIYGGEV